MILLADGSDGLGLGIPKPMHSDHTLWRIYMSVLIPSGVEDGDVSQASRVWWKVHDAEFQISKFFSK